MEHLSGTPAHQSQLKVSTKIKTFVLDTNVLLHDPQSIFKFEDNNLAIPVEVLEELDAIKTEQSTERGRNARRVHRILQELLPDSRSMLEGVRLSNGGTLSVIINRYLIENRTDTPAMLRLRAILPDLTKKDNRIIACALFVQEQFPPPTILVTKDVNVQLKARAVGLESEDYLNDKVPEVDEQSYREIPVTVYEMQRFCSEGELDVGAEAAHGLFLNEYVLLRSDQDKTMPARWFGDGIVKRLKIPEYVKAPGGIPIRARNLEQQFFMDALLDDSISLITCFGKAGTGKTLLSTACALHQTCDESGRYDGLSISRPVFALGKDIGFLPGSLEEKMKPWLQPYHDALEVLIPSKPIKEPQFATKKVAKKKARKRDTVMAMMAAAQPASVSQPGLALPSAPIKPYERLLRSGLVEIEALAFIRGRSIARRFFILDEAQQLTPHEVKTVITRISEGSKIVLIGDPAQIDNPYVDARSNGLVYAHNRMKGQALHAHVKLMKGERSRLAELAADLL